MGWSIVPLAVCLIGIRWVSLHGEHWEFGRYGMPETLVAADGLHHPDGSLIDPFTQALIRADVEAEYMLAMVTLCVVMVAFSIRSTLRTRQRQREPLRRLAWLEWQQMNGAFSE